MIIPRDFGFVFASQDRDGSFIAVPLKDTDRRVFGLLGVDTMKDINNRTVFVTHEIQFYQVTV